MRLFLDANTLFLAGYSPTSPVHDLLALARRGACTLVSSGYAREEARRNLQLKGPCDWSARFDAACSLIEPVGEAGPAALDQARSATVADATDMPILGAAIQTTADGLVSGDRRAFGLLFGQSVHGVRILTLCDALTRLLDAPPP